MAVIDVTVKCTDEKQTVSIEMRPTIMNNSDNFILDSLKAVLYVLSLSQEFNAITTF